MRKYIYPVFFFVAALTPRLSISQTQRDTVFRLEEARDFYPLNLASSLLKDPSGLLTIDRVRNLRSGFHLITQEIYNFSEDKDVHVYWLRCSLQNLTGKNLRELFCLHPGLDSVEFFAFLPNGMSIHTKTYAGQLTRAKPFFISRQIAFPLELRPGTTRVYVRIVNYTMRSQALNSIIASLADERLFINYLLEYKLYQGIAIGMLFLILVLHIFIYLFIRDATYLVFLVNVFFTLIYLILRKNYHLEFDFLSPLYGIIPESHDVFGVLISITAIWFAQTFLNTRQEDPLMHRIMNGLMIALGVVGAFLIAFQWITVMNQLTIYLGFISAVLMIVSSIRSYRKGNKLALYVFFGFTLLAFVPLAYLIPVPDYLHYRSDESDLQYLGEAIRSIIFAVGIAHRFYLLKREIAKHEIEKKELALTKEQQLRDEKERISRDLHDNIGAELAILSMELWQASRLYPDDPGINSALVTSASIYNQLRDTIWAIEKNHVKIEDLESRLRVMLWKQGQANTTIQFDLATMIADSQFSLTPAQSINLFRIVQEAVQNAVTHSACTNIKVSIHFNSPGNLQVEIVDNGKGFDPSHNGHNGDGHYGLRNMKRRALEVQGQISIVSTELRGTSVALSFPVKLL